MRLVAFAVAMCAARIAAADPVNLLTHSQTTINVGSTVANKAIKPEHLVDGKLDTAWNSATGDLVGAWIIVRLPKEVTVEAVKLTNGFTKVDPKLGDLFVKNPRITKVRVTHGKTVVEQDLDIGNRDLQDIPITGDGGDYKIEVLAVKMGTKKDWRETCISELEVWGTIPKATKSRPAVFVNSFSPPPPLSEADCVKLLGPANIGVTATVYTDEIGMCEMVSTSGGGSEDYFNARDHAFTLVSLPKLDLLPQPASLTTQINEGLGQATDTTLSTEELVVGPHMILVTVLASDTWNNLPDADLSQLPKPSAKFALYLISKAGLAPVLELDGTVNCVLAEGATAKKATSPDLDFTCGKVVKHFRWTGAKYVNR